LIFTDRACRHAVLHGGEDYQLLFTGSFSKKELQKIKRIVKVSSIGSVARGKGVFLRDSTRKLKPLKPSGWTH
jgi:thiamine monophosphate kinase